jgi:hypothetical protein
MILFYEEKSIDAVISTNSQTVNYPVSNVIDSRLSRIYKTDSSTTAEVVFDMVSAVTADAVCIANHNLTASATIKLQANSSDVWTSPPVDETLVYDADIIVGLITSASYRYWRVQVVDGTNPDGELEFGRIWIGDSYTAPGVAPTVTVDYNSASTKSRSISGQSYLDGNYKYHILGVRHPAITHTQKAVFQDVLDTVDIGTPFFVQFDEICSDLDVFYVSIDGDGFRFTLLTNPQYYTVSYDLLEEV